MRAAAKLAPEPGIGFLDLPAPEPARDEVVVRVRYCGICGSDLPVYRWEGQPSHWAQSLPRVMGHEFAGEIAARGAGVDAAMFPDGLPVAVEPGVTCGRCQGCRRGFPNLCRHRSLIGIDRDGAFAPYVAVPNANVVPLGDEGGFREGAFLEVFALAVHALERARVRPTDRVLVLGAGPVGLAAAALSRLAGCEEVVVAGVGRDRTIRLPVARELGATDAVETSELGDAVFDVVIEASGAAGGVQEAIGRTRTGGRIVALGTPGGPVEVDWSDIVMRAIRVTPIRARLAQHWHDAARLISRVAFPGSFFEVFPLARVDDAFGAALAGTAVKVLVDPAAETPAGKRSSSQEVG